MSDANINSMSFGQLKNEVQMLRDELAIMQRKYEDILYNLDDNNFSSRFVKEKENMKTAISVTAEGIESKVSKEDFESQMMQTADVIATKVSKEDFETQMEQTAESISSIVSKNISAHFESDDHPNDIYTTPIQQSMLCLYDDVYYYYDDFSEEWRKYPADGLLTMFVQTATGFKMVGSVEVTDIVQVANGLYIGDKDDDKLKQIIFSEYARISTTKDDNTGGAFSGLSISASNIKFGSKIHFESGATVDFSACGDINWGDNAPPAVFA